MRLSIFCPNPEEVNALHRVVEPLAFIARDYDLRCTFERTLYYSSIAHSDVVFLQRPWRDIDVAIAETARLAGSKLWIDWDDDLYNVPSWNPASKHYRDKGLKRNLDKLKRMADVVTVSTDVLQEVYGGQVVANALFDQFLPAGPPSCTAKLVSWRGSASHLRDMADVADDLVTCSNEFPDWKFIFRGSPEGSLDTVLGKMREGSWEHVPDEGFHAHMDALRGQAAPIHIVPLSDHAFNRGKSSLAWLEASSAGSVCLAPNWPEWAKPSVQTYEEGRFGETLQSAMDDVEGFRGNRNDDALVDIAGNHLLSTRSRQRVQILNDLSGRGLRKWV